MFTLIQRGGPWVMIPLMGCSMVAVAFVIERVVFWVRLARGRDTACVEAFLDSADKGDLGGAAEAAKDTRDPVLRVLHCGLVHRDYDPSSALEMAASAELARAERFLPVLDTIVTLSPLLGILGTVVGIIQSFDMLSASATVQDPQAVTGGIAQALITTATGLTIAIATLIPFNVFRARADRLRREMEEAATRLEIVLAKRPVGPRRRPQEDAPVHDEMNWA